MNTKHRLVVTPWGRQGDVTGKQIWTMVRHFKERGKKENQQNPTSRNPGKLSVGVLITRGPTETGPGSVSGTHKPRAMEAKGRWDKQNGDGDGRHKFSNTNNNTNNVAKNAPIKTQNCHIPGNQVLAVHSVFISHWVSLTSNAALVSGVQHGVRCIQETNIMLLEAPCPKFVQGTQPSQPWLRPEDHLEGRSEGHLVVWSN